MTKEMDFEQIKKETPSFRDRMEIGLRMLVKLMFNDKNEHVMVICYYVNEATNQGAIDNIVHTSPGRAEPVLSEALRFYTRHQAEAHEESLIQGS